MMKLRFKMSPISISLLSLSLLLPAAVSAQLLNTEKAAITVTKVADGLEHPWGLAFLPDGRYLVTERTANIRIISPDGSKSAPLKGLPDILVSGQGGLLDVALDPNFSENKLVYISYTEPGGEGSSTAVARATLTDTSLDNLTVIFSAQPKIDSRHHFGSRLVFDGDKHLFITLGDRGSRRNDAQTLDNHHGKVIRIHTDGTVPSDNPYVDDPAVLDNIWSYGHRNIQGAALHPQSGQLWTHEHGPQGGDEINITLATKNYGWPVITYGEEYGGGRIGQTAKAGLEQPLHYWTPSIAPSGMTFYQADAFSGWQNNLLVGSLRFGQLVRLELTDNKVSHEERIMIGQRIRDVRQGPDGSVYLLTDQKDGQLLKLSPAK